MDYGLEQRNTLRLRYEPNRLMLSLGLSRWYINITITILDISHRLFLHMKHYIPETGFCLRLHVEHTARLALSVGPNWVGSTWWQRESPVWFWSFSLRWITFRKSQNSSLFSLLPVTLSCFFLEDWSIHSHSLRRSCFDGKSESRYWAGSGRLQNETNSSWVIYTVAQDPINWFPSFRDSRVSTAKRRDSAVII
jgi:hypothetical protein